jgi:tetratricopeptide (TPR) repeat protein
MPGRAAIALGLAFLLPPLPAQFPSGNNSGISRSSSTRVQSRTTLITGHVFLEDGGAIDAPISILGGCRGSLQVLGYTDLKGNFSLDLRTVLASADAGAARTQVSSVCEIRAKLEGYQSSSIDMESRSALDNPEVGTILLHRISGQEGTTVSVTSLAAPKNAKRAFDKGLSLAAKGRFDEASKQFQKAAGIYPKYADAWFRLGDIQVQQKNTAAARGFFAKAIAADPRLLPPYVEMAAISVNENRWQEAAEYAGRAIHLDPFSVPAVYYFDALAEYNLENWDAAERSARQVEKLDTQHRYLKINRILGAVLARREDYAGAAAQLREYLKLSGDARDAEEVRQQLAELDRRIARAER